jgi:hypothetical protein
MHGLSVGRKLWSFEVNDPFFLRGLVTKTKEHYVINFCKVDIYVGMPTPLENPDGYHVIYKKAVPDIFGEADCLRLKMKNKCCLDNTQVLAHKNTCQLIQTTSKAMNKEFWCDDGDAQIIELPVKCRVSIHKKFPIYLTGIQIQNGQKQYKMIVTCCIECAFQQNHHKRKGKIVVYKDGDVC